VLLPPRCTHRDPGLLKLLFPLARGNKKGFCQAWKARAGTAAVRGTAGLSGQPSRSHMHAGGLTAGLEDLDGAFRAFGINS
jgi:hypothetical protein